MVSLPASLPALVAMRDFKFKLDMTALGGNGGKLLNVLMAGNDGGGVMDNPGNPRGNLQPCGKPHLAKLGG